MSLCERVMELSDGLADLLLAADACADEGETLRLLQSAIDQAHTVKFGNECARAILTTAVASVREQRLPPHLPVPANDHTPTPSQPDPLIA